MVTSGDDALNEVTSALAGHQIVARQLRAEQANLEDAFVALTGRPDENWPTGTESTGTESGAVPPGRARHRGQPSSCSPGRLLHGCGHS